jgi:alpha-1,2-mannosyltransferase
MSLLENPVLASARPPGESTDGRAAVAPTGGRRRILLVVLLTAIGLVAFLLRLAIMVRGGGLHGLGSYDDGVYYAAADALVHGRLPYRDFLLIQPPLITVVTAPFAALGTVVSDPVGFQIARLAFMGIGAANAVLCGAILRRFGWSAVVVGGFGYAVFHPAVFAERSVLLEPLGTFGVLLAILLLQRAATHPRVAILAGVAGGLAVGAKIWYIVPTLVLVLMAPKVRLRYLIGVAIGGCAIYLPFLAAAPQRMVQEVVLNQLGRGGSTTTSSLHRIMMILGVHSTGGVPPAVIAPILALLATAAVLAALATRSARTFGVLAIATLLVLLLSPSWFVHYTALTAPPLALCLGIGSARLAAVLPGRWLRVALTTVVVLGVVVANEANDRTHVGVRPPAGLTAAAAAVPGCITADDPGTLIELNVLSRDLRDRTCAVWPDVTGWTYDPKDLTRTAAGGLQKRKLNARWQHDITTFLESGDATIRTRGGTGYSAASKRIIDSGAVLFRDGRFVIHATHRP